MDIKDLLASAILAAAQEAAAAGAIPGGELSPVEFTEPPSKEFGDFSTNFAMQNAKALHMNPRIIAREIVNRLRCEKVDRAEVAGAGFINFFLKDDFLADTAAKIYAAGDKWGNLPPKDEPPVMIEYVSANPTGPLHVGHGRGAAVGSALVNIFRAAGYDTKSEFYINDAGNQMANLARSVNARYLELFGRDVVFPEDGYHGEDIIATAQRIKDKDGDKYLSLTDEERQKIFLDLAYTEKLAALKEDLAAFRVTFDVWFSERTLHDEAIDSAIADLKKVGKAYEENGALWLKSTDYGDDKDRVIVRDNGVGTYLAADIAYHKNKFERGFKHLINIWGADHHGYICRVKAAMSALGYDPEALEIMLLQMVSLYRDGEPVKMSKRTGQSVTLNELMEEVGVDAARYFFLMRSPDSQLDFDIDLAKKQGNENPVYYIQYAHARIKSVFKSAAEAGLKQPGAAEEINFNLLQDESEEDIIKLLSAYPDEVERAAKYRAPQAIARYAHDLASLFHGFYARCRVLGVEEELAVARLALLAATANTLEHALGLLGVAAPDKM